MSRYCIVAILLLSPTTWVRTNASSTGNNAWDFLGKLSRVAPQENAAVTPHSENASAPSRSLVNHANNDQPNWLKRVLTRRLWKPAQSLVPPSLRHDDETKKQTLQQQQQRQQQHVEVTNHQDGNDNHNKRHLSSQPDMHQPPVSSSSRSQQQSEHEEDDGELLSTSSLATTSPPPWASAILAAVSPLLHGRRLMTGIQVGLIALLLQQVWKAAQEVLEEYTAELNGTGDTGSSGGGALKPDLVERVVQAVDALQQQQQYQADKEEMQGKKNDGGGRKTDRRERQMPLLDLMPPNLLPWIQLAQNLIAAGLPLRRTHMGQVSSVEQVLRSATRTELALLQQCLWTPSASASSSSVSRPQGNQHELLSSVALPFAQIAGLDSVKQRLIDLLLLLQQQQQQQQGHPPTDDDDMFATLNDYSHLLFPSESHVTTSAPTSVSAKSTLGPIRAGILLYGPPGCGKTLLVKALASTAHMPCLVVSPSALLRKFVGDSNQQVRALFTLASKLGNCIICIDELDGLFRQRHDQEHDVTRDLKTEFLQWWDGMMVTMQGNPNDGHNDKHFHDSSNGRRPLLVVVGATNRPFDVDPAVLRRLPQSHYIGLPSTSGRLELLHQLIYRNRKVPPSPRRRHGAAVPPADWHDQQDLDLVQLAMATQGYTPSDMQQLLQTAVTMGPFRRMQAATATKTNGNESTEVSQQLTTQDVLNAMAHVRPTPLSSSYQRALDKFVLGNNPSSVSDTQAAQGMSTTASKWETNWGNFYHIGTLEMDMSSWIALQQVLFQYNDKGDDNEESGNQGRASFHDENYPPQHDVSDNLADNDEEEDDEDDDGDDL